MSSRAPAGEPDADRTCNAASRTLHGFSLVELLIVVAIIALLAAILLPGLSRAREYAYFTCCKSNLRQIGIGFLIYASNNRGCLPGSEGKLNECTETTVSGWTGRKIGNTDTFWIGRHLPERRLYNLPLLHEIYQNRLRFVTSYSGWTYSGTDWDGEPVANATYFGDPRVAGMYLPVEILWDPIVGVRNWGEWGSSVAAGASRQGYSGTEQERDWLTRHNLLVGYALYTHTTGCTRNRSDHKLPSASNWKSEAPFRPYTKHRTIRTTAKPSAWIGACLPPLLHHGYERRFFSHFGVRQTVPGALRFNILHLDGHVDDTVWKDKPQREATPAGHLTYCAGSGFPRPYGWPLKYEWFGTGAWIDGIVDEPVFDGAFDCNR